MNSIVERYHASQAPAPRPAPHGPFFVRKPDFTIDVDQALRRYCGASPEFRAFCAEELRTYDADLRLVERRSNLLDTRQAKADLEARGYFINADQNERAFEMQSTEEEKRMANAPVIAQIRRRLETTIAAKVGPFIDQVIAELETDLAVVERLTPSLRKYNVPESSLGQALADAISLARTLRDRPFDTSWHYDVRVAVSQSWFPDDAPLVVDEPPEAASPAAPTPQVAPGQLRTAAAVAATRVA